MVVTPLCWGVPLLVPYRAGVVSHDVAEKKRPRRKIILVQYLYRV